MPIGAVVQSMIELSTGICRDAAHAEADLRATAERLLPIARGLGVRFIASGTHPTARYTERLVFPADRYHGLIARNQWIARRLQIFGLHVWPGLTTGTVAGNAGVIMGAMSSFEIDVRGRGGHGAMPHTTADPVSCAAKIVVELQTIVSRETNPFEPTVVSGVCLLSRPGLTSLSISRMAWRQNVSCCQTAV